MGAVKKYIDSQIKNAEIRGDRKGYERAAKIAKDRGIQLPPYERNRDNKDDNRKPSE